MPSKNSIKTFLPDSFYHIYNRGVDKRTIFQDDQDYSVFISYLKTYLLPKDETRLKAVLLQNPASTSKEKDKAIKLLRLNNFSQNATLLAYCLMSNHFHILIKQKEADTIDRFMNSLGTRYSMYFNRKHKRVGTLFQDVYKAVPVTSDEQLLHLSRYIHRNSASQGDALRSYQFSSYPSYLRIVNNDWVNTDIILSYFSQKGFNSYESFTEGKDYEDESVNYLKSVLFNED